LSEDREQNGSQDRNDGDHNEQFNERKRFFFLHQTVSPWMSEFDVANKSFSQSFRR
jgi:hypothetical protein